MLFSYSKLVSNQMCVAEYKFSIFIKKKNNRKKNIFIETKGPQSWIPLVSYLIVKSIFSTDFILKSLSVL